MPELTPKLGIKKPLGNETVSRAAFNENWDIIDQKAVGDMGGVPTIQAGLDAEKPAPGTAGRLYVATDTQMIYRDTGTAWQKVGVVKWGDIDGKPASFTPSAHKTTHATGGADALAPADIGAAAQTDFAAHLADDAAHNIPSHFDPTTGHKHTGAAGDGPQIDPSAFATANWPAFRAYQSTAQSLAAATWTKIAFQTENYDQGNVYDNAEYQFIAPTGGIYIVSARVHFAGGLDGENHAAAVYVNGAAHSRLKQGPIGAVDEDSVGGTVLLKLAAGDYVEIYGYSSNARDTQVASTYTYFAAVRVA
ncbi:Complement C1q protein [Moorella glycerini]|uniref:C1q domain protein n=1 Tax=Neomoorella stamsii TaxID=1266720 RepID=A0A9X7J199_9FIRM|nr:MULTISPECIES: hypothetical protein [Moorella]PRR69579.1 C1q domain protein [Moorella stamsii]CEP67897.1 Complement C1q protein [Moorella glycerini]CEP68767.1 Complement C1q protein [Moorella glycerini]